MLDCSRNAVFTVEKVKSVIRTLAKMGMNVLMLYTEDTYEVPGEPYFGSYRGRYIKAEIQEMDAYAFHVWNRAGSLHSDTGASA